MNIIELAREASVSIRGHYDETGSTPQELKRFATLVRAQVLEEAAQKCDDLWQDDGTAYDCREAIRALKGEQT